MHAFEATQIGSKEKPVLVISLSLAYAVTSRSRDSCPGIGPFLIAAHIHAQHSSLLPTVEKNRGGQNEVNRICPRFGPFFGLLFGAFFWLFHSKFNRVKVHSNKSSSCSIAKFHLKINLVLTERNSSSTLLCKKKRRRGIRCRAPPRCGKQLFPQRRRKSHSDILSVVEASRLLKMRVEIPIKESTRFASFGQNETRHT